MESNHPTGGLLRPAGFEDRMGHQTPAAPRAILEPPAGRVCGYSSACSSSLSDSSAVSAST